MVDAAVFCCGPFLGFFGHCKASLECADFSMNFGWGGFCCIALISDYINPSAKPDHD